MEGVLVCRLCNGPMTTQEHISYRDRCENCWARSGNFGSPTGQGPMEPGGCRQSRIARGLCGRRIERKPHK